MLKECKVQYVSDVTGQHLVSARCQLSIQRLQALNGTGGAIHVEEFQNMLTLEDVLFLSNTAAVSGGAVWAASSLQGQMKVSGSVFTANKVCGFKLPACTKHQNVFW
jgi:predicted outer membrane repeat protein